MRLSIRTLERVLFSIGAVLCLFYLGVMAYRAVGSRMAVRSFEIATAPAAASDSRAKPPESSGALVDFRLWSARRLAAYKDALAKQFTPPLAILRIQKLGLEVPVFDGTDEFLLNRGVGRIAGTARPGEDGNLGIAGHRDGFFRALKDISAGDSITLETGSGILEYEVESVRIVGPDDVGVLAKSATPVLTLVTCYPFYFAGEAPQRWIVRSSLKRQPQTRASTAGPHASSRDARQQATSSVAVPR